MDQSFGLEAIEGLPNGGFADAQLVRKEFFREPGVLIDHSFQYVTLDTFVCERGQVLRRSQLADA
jgi:hypothetical protein